MGLASSGGRGIEGCAPIHAARDNHSTQFKRPRTDGGSMPANGQRREIRLCVIGESSVGKTTLLRQYVYGTPDEGHEGALGEFTFDVQVQTGSELVDVRLVILDYRGGRGPDDAAEETAFRGKHGFLAVADLAEPRTLYAL